MRQLSLFLEPKPEHGGTLNRGKRKCRRPLSTHRPIHVVLKSRLNILPSWSGIAYHCRRLGGRFGLKVYGFGSADDHVHLVIKIPSREAYKAFIRSFTGLLARKLGAKLWQQLPYSRVATWGREFRALLAYCHKNQNEAEGLWAYEPRGRRKAKPA